jgi:hypothetical protein
MRGGEFPLDFNPNIDRTDINDREAVEVYQP